ncbi:MAG: hypothetical protein ACOVO2_24950 [Emticicia sp.]|uniref:hypothetical protein n=1 Tax=Emticicia sp. TaxID=1930953 RepID=UPI003BA4CC5F
MKTGGLRIFLMIIGLFCGACRPKYISNSKYFETPINISAKGAILTKNDTLWIEIKPNPTLRETKTNKEYTFQNASYTLSARMEAWRKNFNATDFLNNFQIVTQKGSLINYSISSYNDGFLVDFGMRFGYPDESELKFGIVCSNVGIFSLTFGGNINPGVNNSNCQKNSCQSENSYLLYAFKPEDTNWAIYDKLTKSEKRGTEKYYTEKQKNERNTYFFEVTE